MRRLLLTALLLIAASGGFALPHVTWAASIPLCFPAPGVKYCVSDRFREYWEQNGGLPVFGYPITPAALEQTGEGVFLVQYFERNRFELHPEHARPYDVLLGRLGDDRLRQQGRDWQRFPRGQRNVGCLWFEETGHSVCNQEGSGGFRSYWESHGVLDPALSPYARSLALFGLPLSEPLLETNAAGDTVLTQWFERGRFEWHPDKPREFKVLLGLLGNEAGPSCQIPISDSFGRLWHSNAHVRLELGCPVTEAQTGAAAEQIFEHGLMYYWSGTDEIYVLVGAGTPGGGQWFRLPNTWHEGEALAPLTPPPGLLAPERGFGKAWRESQMLQVYLGWARLREAGFAGASQRFQRGVMLYSGDINGHPGRIYVLYDANADPHSAYSETYPD
jgi:hypothetical protein